MKIRSKALWQYLHDSGALHGSAEDIHKAKALYRKEYKKRWKRSRNERRKELRPSFTLKEYYKIKLQAHNAGLSPTAYIRALVIASFAKRDVIAHRETLQKVYQLVGMALMTFDYYSKEKLLQRAETLLKEYLQIDC